MNAKQQILLDYLKLNPQGVKEYELITHLNKKFQYFSELGENATLFKQHFYLFHQLYLLSELIKGEKRWLEISALSIRLHSHLEYEQPENKQPQLREFAGEIIELKAFYLNKENLELPDKEIEEMLALFWQKYLALDQKADAIKCLGLQEHKDLNLKEIKNRYNQMASRHHPDKGGDEQLAQMINRARDILLEDMEA